MPVNIFVILKSMHIIVLGEYKYTARQATLIIQHV